MLVLAEGATYSTTGPATEAVATAILLTIVSKTVYGVGTISVELCIYDAS